ncbi:unnamed protein product [Cladocopium goreaui]|uniref:Uncharacterized protein n=1 Tax=Cladocopium goreaui TaxID=2562237 RepID=A0A9P1CMK7_9DINO|nr:unnamed protein product [Cladocopium goreaui]
MAPDNLEDVLTKSGVDSNLTNSLMMEGWTSQTFRVAAADAQGFEEVLQEWSTSHPLSTLQKACLRTAFQSLQPQQGTSSSAFPTPAVNPPSSAGSWAEAFPPKLEHAVLVAMKQKFMSNYPSELIHADVFPSTRLVSLVHDQLTKKVWKWVPWKFRISLTKSEEISSNRAQKMPKLDHLGLHALLFDDPPSLEVSNNAMGVNSIHSMLEVHDRAIALCQGRLPHQARETQESSATDVITSSAGLPNLTAWELQKVQESFIMLSRCVEVLTLVFQSGGHVHLEQPLNAMSWLESLRDESGAFASRATAQYPSKLAQHFATLVAPLLHTPAFDLQWSSVNTIMPIKSLSDYPFAQIDGGGAFSHPDWSQDQRQEQDWFHGLRTSWMSRIVSSRLDKILMAHVASGNLRSPFSTEVLSPSKDDLETTGFSTAIPPSGIFPPKERADTDSEPLSAHLSNWQSAEEDLSLTRELVQEEVDQGWVFAYPGSLDEAQAEYPAGVAIGKLGVARSEGRAPRLVVDSSVCGLNDRCIIPERSTLPTAKEVLRSYPLGNSQKALTGFSLDVKDLASDYQSKFIEA